MSERDPLVDALPDASLTRDEAIERLAALRTRCDRYKGKLDALAEAYNVACEQHRELEAAVMEEWGHNQNQSMQARRVLGPDTFAVFLGRVGSVTEVSE